MTVLIEPLRGDDIPAILAIEEASFPRPWSRALFERELRIAISHFFTVRDSDTRAVAGYGGYWLVAGEAHLLTLAVAPGRRGQGLGMKLVNFLIAHAGERGAGTMLLEVRADNTVAQNMYARCGFTVSGRRPGYYEGTMDAILMECAL